MPRNRHAPMPHPHRSDICYRCLLPVQHEDHYTAREQRWRRVLGWVAWMVVVGIMAVIGWGVALGIFG